MTRLRRSGHFGAARPLRLMDFSRHQALELGRNGVSVQESRLRHIEDQGDRLEMVSDDFDIIGVCHANTLDVAERRFPNSEDDIVSERTDFSFILPKQAVHSANAGGAVPEGLVCQFFGMIDVQSRSACEGLKIVDDGAKPDGVLSRGRAQFR